MKPWEFNSPTVSIESICMGYIFNVAYTITLTLYYANFKFQGYRSQPGLFAPIRTDILQKGHLNSCTPTQHFPPGCQVHSASEILKIKPNLFTFGIVTGLHIIFISLIFELIFCKR